MAAKRTSDLIPCAQLACRSVYARTLCDKQVPGCIVRPQYKVTGPNGRSMMEALKKKTRSVGGVHADLRNDQAVEAGSESRALHGREEGRQVGHIARGD